MFETPETTAEHIKRLSERKDTAHENFLFFLHGTAIPHLSEVYSDYVEIRILAGIHGAQKAAVDHMKAHGTLQEGVVEARDMTNSELRNVIQSLKDHTEAFPQQRKLMELLGSIISAHEELHYLSTKNYYENPEQGNPIMDEFDPNEEKLYEPR
ncbi:MAG: hypothetical protein H9W81_09815 [Enterococcus sp.]|nr:hypothetical protein [Enterococcus sp.]